MTHKIKMIGLDLDGTLLTDKKELTVRTREVLAKAIRSGIVVLVATGRPWMGVPEELREFPGMDYALTSNGARIIDTRTGNVIEEHCCLSNQRKRRWKICRKILILYKRYILMDRDMLRQKKGVCGNDITKIRICGNICVKPVSGGDIFELVDRENRGLDKTQALFADMSERKRAWEELARHEDLELVGSLRYNIEVNAAGVNKGTGLVNLGSRLGY